MRQPSSSNVLKYSPIPVILLSLLCISLPACRRSEAETREDEPRKIKVTNPVVEDVTVTQPYVCQIHSRQHIEVRALSGGYLQEIFIKEGQAVKEGDVLFKILPPVYEAEWKAAVAERDLAKIELTNKEKLFADNVVSEQQVKLAQAKLDKAEADMNQRKAELNFTDVKAPFDGIVDRQLQQVGSLIKEGEVLTTVSDNSVMWVYFNVPEANYIEYKEKLVKGEVDDLQIELKLANGKIFPYRGTLAAIEADFNNLTGNVAFRADFPNPDGLLRYGQTGTILVSRVLKDAIVIPQRCKYEILAKTYVYVVAPLDAKQRAALERKKAAEERGEAVAEPSGEETAEPGSEQVAEQSSENGAEEGAAHGSENGEEHNEHYGVVHQREIIVEQEGELDDIYVIKQGLEVTDKIILEGVLQVRDGDEVRYEYHSPEEVLSDLKYKAE